MAHYFYLSLIVLLASCYADNQKFGSGTPVEENVDEFLTNYPNAKSVKQVVAVEPFYTHHYTLGNRVFGDVLLAQRNETVTFTSLKDFQYKLKYPGSGLGARVTMVDVWVDQTSNIGHAYIVEGGLGQRTITVIFEAKQTTLFRYTSRVYGV